MQKTLHHCTPRVFVLVLFITLLQQCSKPGPAPYPGYGTWTKQAAITGPGRAGAATFTIGGTAYICTGYNGVKRLNDLLAYNGTSNYWSQKAGFPGAARSSAVAFAIGAAGYVGTGYDGNTMFTDFWRWDEATNTWDSSAPFPGSPRYDAVAFGIGSYGYVATGFDGTSQNDFWQYDPSAGPMGAWVQKTSFGGEKRSGAISFVYGTKGYIVTGIDNGVECGDFWYYDANLDQWVQLRNIYNSNQNEAYDGNYTNIERDHGVGFVIGDSAFITTGKNGGLLTATWGYDFATDQWVPKAPFTSPARQGATGFALNGYGYVCSGQNGTNFYNDLIMFDPNR